MKKESGNVSASDADHSDANANTQNLSVEDASGMDALPEIIHEISVVNLSTDSLDSIHALSEEEEDIGSPIQQLIARAIISAREKSPVENEAIKIDASALDPALLERLPRNIREHIKLGGIQVTQFRDDYKFEVSDKEFNAVIQNILTACGEKNDFDEYRKLLDAAFEDPERYKVKLSPGQKAEIAGPPEKNVSDVLNNEQKIKIFKRWLDRELYAVMQKKVRENESNKKISLTDIFERELKLMRETPRPAFINVDANGKVRAEFPCHTDRNNPNDPTKPTEYVTRSAYDRRGVANHMLRVHAYATFQGEALSSLEILEGNHRSANFTPTRKFKLYQNEERVTKTARNLLEFAQDAVEIDANQNWSYYAAARKGKKPMSGHGRGTQEKPLIVFIDAHSLLSALPEPLDAFDPQQQRKQIVCVYKAMLALNEHFNSKSDKSMPVSVTTPTGENEDLHIKPQFHLADIGVNFFRFFTAAEQRQMLDESMSFTSRCLLRELKQTRLNYSHMTFNKPSQGMACNRCYKLYMMSNQLLETVKNPRHLPAHGRLHSAHKLWKTSLGSESNNRSFGQEFETELRSLHDYLFNNEESNALSPSDRQRLLDNYHSMNNLYGMFFSYFEGHATKYSQVRRKAQQEILGEEFYSQNNYLCLAYMTRLTSDMPFHINWTGCKDSVDRTNLFLDIMAEMSHQEKTKGYAPRAYFPGDLKDMKREVLQSLHTSPGLQTASANRRGATCLKINTAHGYELDDQLTALGSSAEGPKKSHYSFGKHFRESVKSPFIRFAITVKNTVTDIVSAVIDPPIGFIKYLIKIGGDIQAARKNAAAEKNKEHEEKTTPKKENDVNNMSADTDNKADQSSVVYVREKGNGVKEWKDAYPQQENNTYERALKRRFSDDPTPSVTSDEDSNLKRPEKKFKSSI